MNDLAIPDFLKRQPTGSAVTKEPEKTRKPRMTPIQKAIFQLNSEIAVIDKKLSGHDSLVQRRQDLEEAIRKLSEVRA